MFLFQFGVLILMLACGDIRCIEEGRKASGDSLAEFAPSELERESPIGRTDNLYGELKDDFHGELRNETLSRMQIVQFGEDSLLRHSRQANLDPELGEFHKRVQRPASGRPASSRLAKKKQQRYLPYSPSYGKAAIRDSFLPEEMAADLGSEKLIFRQSRDTTGVKRKKPRVQAAVSGPVSGDAPSASSGYPAIFAYDIALAEDSGVTARQVRPSVVAASPENTESTPDILSFDIALPVRPTKPTQIDRNRLQRAMGPAMQGARQDFVQKVANPRPDQCLVNADNRESPALIWTVGKPSQNTRFAYQSEFAGRRLADQFTGGNADHLFAYLDQDDIDQSQMAADDEDCFEDAEVECDPDSPYRTFDGTCNNLQKPLQGSANSAQSRLGPAEYEDGIAEPRRLSLASQIQNRPLLLPSAREVSVAISSNLDRESKKITYLFNQFAQFIAHDVTNTPVEKVQDPQDPKRSVTPSCCGTDAACIHPACFPILIPANDPVYGQFSQNCLEFVRSQPAAQSGCRLGKRIPLDQVTAYIDGSQIYGSKVSDANRLRAKRRGLLRTNDSPICLQTNVVMIPGGPDSQGCKAPDANRKCVDAGDLRANQHTGLVAFHSLFLRLHNQIANFIAEKRPRASDEVIFMLTRKIVGGILQHIYYKEMIPIMLGSKLANDPQNGLAVTKKGYCQDCYDENVDASMQVEFAAGAYRFHTLGDNTLPVADANGVEYPLYQHFGNPAMWYKPGIIDELLRNLPGKPAEAFDAQFAFVFQNQIFKPVSKPLGIDLLAFNIQRGRDHGVPAYIKMREICGLAPVKTFKDLERFMPKDAADNLASIYRHVRDIDFYAGGLSERSVNKQGLVGPTFACVLTDQFQKLKNGDRFWYENDGVFTPKQLKEIKKVSMAVLLCQNSQTEQVQPKPFLIASESGNPITPCGDILAKGAMKLEPFLVGLRRSSTREAQPDVSE
ncbi:Chorion peroxidase [Hypsibius exemplaris]|uniref:Chorion peroxidase n=1 Tax=Hypsibius exemplaris TaxID=2072580 RepID=A0A1W0XBH2_HYPEX|nr:Chorion peroxidase [Hypsibius exemplaris]